MKACGELQPLERQLFGEARADQGEDRHLARGPIDEVLALRGQVEVFYVVAFRADFQIRCFLLVNDLTDYFDVGQALAPAQVFELDEDLDPAHLPAQLADQANRGGRGAARRQYIIDDQHLLAGLDGVRVKLELIRSVLELVGVADGLPRQLTDFADRDEAGVELDRDRRARDESARLDGRYKVWSGLRPALRHHVDDL